MILKYFYCLLNNQYFLKIVSIKKNKRNMLKVNRSDFLIKPFLKRNNFRAFYQIISTIFPIISIWLIVYQIINQPFSLLIKGFLLIPIIFF